MDGAVFLVREVEEGEDSPLLDLKGAGCSSVRFPIGADRVDLNVVVLVALELGERGPRELVLRLVNYDGVQYGQMLSFAMDCEAGPTSALRHLTWPCASAPGNYRIQLAEGSGRILFQYPLEIESTQAGSSA